MTAFTVDPRQKKIVDANGRPIGLPINDFGSRSEIEFVGFTYSSSLSIALYLINPDYRDGQTMPIYYGTTWTESNGAYKHEMKYGEDYYNSVTQNDSLARLVLVADSVVVLDQVVQIDMIYSYSEDAERLPVAAGGDYATEAYVNAAVSGKADRSELEDYQEKITAEEKLDYSLLSGTPTIPLSTSQLVNNSDFATSSYVQQETSGKITNPSGGTLGQVLTKTDDGEEWADAQGGGGSDTSYNDYLRFVAANAGSTIALNKSSDVPELSASLEYSTDGSTWTAYSWSGTAGTVITLANVGDTVYFRGNNKSFSTSSANYQFEMSGKINGYGNINTLLTHNGNIESYVDYGETETSCKFVFSRLFYNCKDLYKAPYLPTKKLTSYCYSYIFAYCTHLENVPLILAEDLAGYSFYFAFAYCYSLHGVNMSFAHTQGERYSGTFFNRGSSAFDYCFSYCSELRFANLNFDLMPPGFEGAFSNCTALTFVKITGTAGYAKSNFSTQFMFEKCNALKEFHFLVTVPEIASYHYSNYDKMFYNNTNKNNVKVSLYSIPDTNCVLNNNSFKDCMLNIIGGKIKQTSPQASNTLYEMYDYALTPSTTTAYALYKSGNDNVSHKIVVDVDMTDTADVSFTYNGSPVSIQGSPSFSQGDKYHFVCEYAPMISGWIITPTKLN